MKPITHKEVLDMLISARGFVEKGWIKDQLNNGDEKKLKVCSLGGIEAALARALNKHVLDAHIPDADTLKAGVRTGVRMECAPGPTWDIVTVEVPRAEYVAYEAMSRLAATIKGRRIKRDPGGHVANFNDLESTRKADVLRAFDRTISRTANRRPYAPCKPMKAVSK